MITGNFADGKAERKMCRLVVVSLCHGHGAML